MEIESFPKSIKAAIAQALSAELTQFQRLENGSTGRTFLIGNAVQEWIVRLEQPPALRLKRSLLAQQRAGAAGLPVPKIIAYELNGARAADYNWIVEERVRSEGFAHERMNRAARLAACADMGGYLRRLHAIEVDGFGALQADGLTAEHPGLEQWLAARAANIDVALNLAGAEAKDSAPLTAAQQLLRESYTGPARLCHGDFAGKNLLLARGRLAAVVDWEGACGSDPAFDVAYFYFWHKDQDCLNALLASYDPPEPEAFRQRVLAHFKLLVVDLNVYISRARPELHDELLQRVQRELRELLEAPARKFAAPGLVEQRKSPTTEGDAPSNSEEQVKEAITRKARANLSLLPQSFFAAQREVTVTVVMLSYGRLEQTLNAIRALKEHVSIPFALLLIDNGSDSEVQQQLGAVAASHDFIELVCLAENLGCAGGRALALAYVKTAYVMFIDNDIEVMPGTVEHLLHSLEEQPDVVAAAGQAVFPTGLLHLCGGNYWIEDGVLFYELLGWGRQFGDPAVGESGLCKWVNGGLTMLRTEFLKNHPYDASMQGYYEDLEWCYRLNQEGKGNFYRCVEAVAVHYHESKLPDADLTEAQRRRQSLQYIEAIARFYHVHQHVIQNLFDFIPELGPASDEGSVLSGRLILALINLHGSEWFLKQWEESRLDLPFLAKALLAKLGQQEIPGGALPTQLAELIKAREVVTTLLAEQQRQTGSLIAQASAREVQIDQLVERLTARLSERDAQLVQQQQAADSLSTLLNKQRQEANQLAAQLTAQELQSKQLAEFLTARLAAREAQLAEQKQTADWRGALLAAQQQQIEQRAAQVRAQAAEQDQREQALSAQLAEQREKVRALVGQVGERQGAVESLAAQIVEQQRKIKSLIAHVAERQRAVETIVQSRLFKILSLYWRARTSVRRARARSYAAFRRLLRGLIAYRWRRQIIKTVRRPAEFVWRINLKLFRIVVQFSVLLPKSINMALAFQIASKDGPPAVPLPTRFKAASAEASALGSEESPGGGLVATYDVLCFPVIDWEFRFQRPQQLLTQFARTGHRVFYLRTTFHQHGDRLLQQEIAERITGLQLPGPATLNLYQHQLDETNLEHFLRVLDEFRLEAGITAAVCMVQLPFWRPLADAARARWGWKIIYDCMDEHSGFSTNTPAMLVQEEELIRSSDLVVATARPLLAKTEQLAARTLLLPNAADFDHFKQPGPERLLPHLTGPIIGYYGAISDWFDVEMVRHAAIARPQWQFVLIGDTFGANIESLKPLPNVHLLGEQSYASLPGYLDRFDVACIPFQLTPLTEATNPVKFYEYLCAGKPVVAIELPELEPFRDYFYPVATPADFIPQIEAALAEQAPTAVQQRVDFAQQQTWQARYQELDQIIPQLYGPAAIIIVSYNNLAYLQLCLDSIWAMTEYPNYQVIAVDNGSQPEVIAYLLASAQREPRLKVILNGQNLGFAAANNIGIKAAGECKYVVLLNNDTVVTRGWLSKLVHYLDDSAVGLIGPVTNSIGNEAKINVDYQDLEDLAPFAERYTRAHAGEAFNIAVLAMYCVGMRKALLDQIGLLDERFGVGMFEDDDYSLRVRRAGYRIVCAEDIFIHHWGGASFKKLDRDYYDRIFDENLKKFEEKWGAKWQPHRYRAGVGA